MQRRTKTDLKYLVQTTDANGDTNHDEALFAEREQRLVEHGWKDSVFGETTESGAALSQNLQEYARSMYGETYASDPAACVEELASKHGVRTVLQHVRGTNRHDFT